MPLEIAANIGVLIGIVGFMLFFLRRLDRLQTGIKADMEKMETGIKADMEKMETGIRADMEKMETGIRADMEKMETRVVADMNLKHGEVREDLRDVRLGLVEVRERQARLEGIVEGMGYSQATAASSE